MLSVKLEGFDKAMRWLDPKKVEKAAARAINDAASRSRTEASKAIRDRFSIKAKRVNQEVKKIGLARVSNLEAEVRAEGRPIGLMNFGAKVQSARGRRKSGGSSRSRGRGVAITVEKGRKFVLPNAFIARGRSGSVDGSGAKRVFQRSNLQNNRSGLMSKSSITIASMMKQERVMIRVLKRVDDVLNARFKHHLSRFL